MRTAAVGVAALAAVPRMGGRPSAWAPGMILPCGLRLLRVLGEGGTAVVWEACGPGGVVAVKTLHAGLVGRAGFPDILLREARKGRQVSHPALVRVLGDGVDAGRPYVVFERLQGSTLADAGLAGLSRARVGRLLAGPAGALARMHAAGMVHGDVKPGNLFVETCGAVRLLDLGAARMTAGSALDATGWLPPHGMPSATPRWAAPERLRGEGPDPRDDVHSLALVVAALVAAPVGAGLVAGRLPRAVRAALGPRAGRPDCPVAMVRSLSPWGGLWLG